MINVTPFQFIIIISICFPISQNLTSLVLLTKWTPLVSKHSYLSETCLGPTGLTTLYSRPRVGCNMLFLCSRIIIDDCHTTAVPSIATRSLPVSLLMSGRPSHISLTFAIFLRQKLSPLVVIFRLPFPDRSQNATTGVLELMFFSPNQN